MPKIIGFAFVLIGLGFLLSTMFEVLVFFSKYGATPKELLFSMATIFTSGGLFIFVCRTLW